MVVPSLASLLDFNTLELLAQNYCPIVNFKYKNLSLSSPKPLSYHKTKPASVVLPVSVPSYHSNYLSLGKAINLYFVS